MAWVKVGTERQKIYLYPKRVLFFHSTSGYLRITRHLSKEYVALHWNTMYMYTVKLNYTQHRQIHSTHTQTPCLTPCLKMYPPDRKLIYYTCLLYTNPNPNPNPIFFTAYVGRSVIVNFAVYTSMYGQHRQIYTHTFTQTQYIRNNTTH